MELDQLNAYIKAELYRAIGAYQSYQAGNITRVKFNKTLALIADAAAQNIALSYDTDE